MKTIFARDVRATSLMLCLLICVIGGVFMPGGLQAEGGQADPPIGPPVQPPDTTEGDPSGEVIPDDGGSLWQAVVDLFDNLI